MIDAIMFVCELIIATLLYAQASGFRSRALTVLATCFVFAALLLVPHAFTFPGAFAPDGLLGARVNTTAWIYTFRRAAFPIAIILYVWLKRADLAARMKLTDQRPGSQLGGFSNFPRGSSYDGCDNRTRSTPAFFHQPYGPD
jgi:hypothetical protein